MSNSMGSKKNTSGIFLLLEKKRMGQKIFKEIVAKYFPI